MIASVSGDAGAAEAREVQTPVQILRDAPKLRPKGTFADAGHASVSSD